jgi:plastocyanin
MKKLVAFLALALAALALVACGSSSDNSSSTESKSGAESQESRAEQGGPPKEASGGESGGSTLKFEADPNGQLAFTTDHMTAKAGKVTIDFTNPQSLSHDVVIEDSSGKEIARAEPLADGSDSTTADLKPGTYHYFCSIPGHREAGMEGVLVVK